MSDHSGQLDRFAHISLVDFEFRAVNGNRPYPVCLVVKDYRSGCVRRYWRHDLLAMRSPPFPIGDADAMVAFYASAELGCMLELGWQLPRAIIDLFAEHRVETNGLYLKSDSFLSALAWRGLEGIDVAAKNAMRELVLNQLSWTT